MKLLVGLAQRVWLALAPFLFALSAPAQDDYEIQVYASETVPVGKTMVELHNNYTIEGERQTVNGVFPSYHAFHETLEITQGLTPWFETGFYVFSSIQPGKGWEWVGDHLRPRVRVPEEWHWPVGLSLSTEVGYQRRSFSEDTCPRKAQSGRRKAGSAKREAAAPCALRFARLVKLVVGRRF